VKLRRCLLEPLESRRMFVVGAFEIPETVLPGSLFDGVVHLSGNSSAFASAPTCSGSLLPSGRHILTAGHCIWQNERQVVSVGNASGGTFQLTLNGDTTDDIPYNASADELEAAIEDAIGENVAVSGGPDGNGNNPWTVEFRGNLKLTDVPLMQANSTNLVGDIVVLNPPNTRSNDGRAGSTRARFDLPSGPIALNAGAYSPAEDFLHPNWNGLFFNGDDEDPNGAPGEDIAIITLPAIAPLGATRYEPYTAQDETDPENLFIMVGYGRTGLGATGEDSGPPDTAGLKRQGLNQYGDIHASSGFLRSDFDDGTEDMNTLGDGIGLGPYESAVARGDSGGPNFFHRFGLNGESHLYITGINSAVDGAGLPGFSAFGARNYFTRVSDYTLNRDPLFDIHDIIHQPDEIVLDMNFQPAGNDGQADLVEVQSDGLTVTLYINGEFLWKSPVDEMLSLLIIGSGDNDVIDASQLPANIPLRVEAGKGDDIVVGGSGPDWLYGQDGKDQIQAGPGDDRVFGGDGDDDLSGQQGNDILYGEGGDDLLSGHIGNDTLIGDIGSDRLYGGSGDDDLVGGVWSFEPIPAAPQPDKDELYGEDGNDYLRGDNVFQYSAGLTQTTGGDDLLIGGPGYDTLDGQAGNDTLKGDSEPDVMNGGLGNDNLDGGSGDDVMWGDAGNDTLIGGPGNDFLTGGMGVDTLDGGEGNDQLIGGMPANAASVDLSSDTLFGGAGDDTIAGDNATFFPFSINASVGSGDTIHGGDGNDVIYGQGGSDRIDGAAGNDNISGGSGNDQIDGGSGDDTINGGAGNDSILGGGDNDSVLGGLGDDQIQGGPGDDSLWGEAGADVIVGDDGNDFIWGGLNNDILVGANGVDTIHGDAGNDELIGGHRITDAQGAKDLSADLLFGDAGADTILGDNGSITPLYLEVNDGGNDLIQGDAGNDVVYGQNGDDQISGGLGDDQLHGGAGDDSILGGANNDQLRGDSGNDRLRGGSGNDSLIGGDGNDVLLGEAGADVLSGESGRDLLVGGVGADSLNGGSGDDLLIGGTTSFDANDPALDQIMAEWRSRRDYATRVDNLKGIVNVLFNARQNGATFLTKGVTVQDDLAAADSLFGDLDQDWFLYDPALDLVDRVKGEVAN